jgi:tetratricopeptide (TPR) repeat protein
MAVKFGPKTIEELGGEEERMVQHSPLLFLSSDVDFAHFSLGKHKQAIECYDKAIQIDPKYAVPWYNKGIALDKLEKKKDAKECYKRAKELGSKG